MTDTAHPAAPPDRIPDYARRDDKDASQVYQQDVAKEHVAERERPVRPAKPVNTPLALKAGDNIIDFKVRVREYTIQNNTGATIYRELDEVATAGSFQVLAGATLNERKGVRRLHIYMTAPATCNDAVAGVVVEGGV